MWYDPSGTGYVLTCTAMQEDGAIARRHLATLVSTGHGCREPLPQCVVEHPYDDQLDRPHIVKCCAAWQTSHSQQGPWRHNQHRRSGESRQAMLRFSLYLVVLASSVHPASVLVQEKHGVQLRS